MKKVFDIAMLLGWLLISAGVWVNYGLGTALIASGSTLIGLTLIDVVIMMKGR